MISKKIVQPILLFTVMGATTFLAAGQAHAQTNTGTNPLQGLVQMIAQKFGLDQNQVQSVVTTYKAQQKQNMQQNRQNRQKTRLDNLVKTGKITSDQETAIINELATLKTKYSTANFKNMTAAQRKQQLQNEQNDINTWAKSQNIDPKYVMPGMGMMGGMRGMHKGWGNKPTPTPTQ